VSLPPASSPRWPEVSDELNRFGFGVLRGVLDPEQCKDLIGNYDHGQFRSTVVMARHGFGSGEYKYFSYPLPPVLADLRARAYGRLVDLANDWYAAMGKPAQFPSTHSDYLKQCHDAGQTRPTPLILKYGSGDYNTLHQDIYGEHVFPLQMAILLSDPTDFDGGEFVLTEQRPRRQSRINVVQLAQGDAVIFAVRERPVRGANGIYRVQHRHGVSQLHRGSRFTAGVIFHDAA
jgi:hypothetical protein